MARKTSRIVPLCILLTLYSSAAFGAQDDELGRLRDAFNSARVLFGSLSTQPESIPEFSRLISRLEPLAAANPGSEYVDLLVSALMFRARANLNFGDEQAADDDLRALLRADPDPDIDRSEISRPLLERYDSIFDQMIGFIEFIVSPFDAQITVDDVLIEPGIVSRSVVAGTHQVAVTRPGFGRVDQTLEVAAGNIESVDVSLDRVSAVIWVNSMPAGATVSIDGRVLDVTRGTAPADFSPTGDAALYSRSEFSDWLIIENVDVGRHTLEVSLDGYRTRSSPVEITDIADFRSVNPLQPTEGTIVLNGLNPAAEVTVDGIAETPSFPNNAPPRLTLPPGEHRIEVSQGTDGVFSADVRLADDTIEVLEVILRPGLAFLGVLGADEIGATDLSAALTDRLSAIEDWSLLERTEAVGVVEQLGLTADALRTAVNAPLGSVDWAAAQAAVDRETPGSVYMLAVLDDDTFARFADLWIWPAAPGPPRPDVVRIELGNAADIAKLGSAFVASNMLTGPWFGALLVDLDNVALVADVAAGSPAEAAGLRVGDRVVSVGGTVVNGATSANAVIQAAAPGTALAVQVQRGGPTDTVEVTLGRSPVVISPSDPSLIYSVISASLAAEAARASGSNEQWVIQLNQAAVLLHANDWPAAVTALRSIRNAPTGPGLGDATVQYWLGIALTALGGYEELAIEAFRNAAANPEARLYSNDGPWVAPRAFARLARLGGLQ